jgi:hypothetical protein
LVAQHAYPSYVRADHRRAPCKKIADVRYIGWSDVLGGSVHMSTRNVPT